MKRQPVAFRVASFAAAAVTLTIPHALHAAPEAVIGVADAPECRYDKPFGEVIRLNSSVRVNGREVSTERTPISRGARVATDGYGAALVCLSEQRWWCRARRDTVFRVGPRRRVVLEMLRDDGWLTCYGGKTWKLRNRGTSLGEDGTISDKPPSG